MKDEQFRALKELANYWINCRHGDSIIPKHHGRLTDEMAASIGKEILALMIRTLNTATQQSAYFHLRAEL